MDIRSKLDIMRKARNVVIAGCGKGQPILEGPNSRLYFETNEQPKRRGFVAPKIRVFAKLLTQTDFDVGVSSYQLMAPKKVRYSPTRRKDSDCVTLEAVDNNFFSGKEDKPEAYVIAVDFKDGKRSLFEIDEEMFAKFRKFCDL